jgi:hypothetical protein
VGFAINNNEKYFHVETDEERVVRQVPDSTDEESIIRQAFSDEDESTVEYEPISYSDEERLMAVHGFAQGMFNILGYRLSWGGYGGFVRGVEAFSGGGLYFLEWCRFSIINKESRDLKHQTQGVTPV